MEYTTNNTEGENVMPDKLTEYGKKGFHQEPLTPEQIEANKAEDTKVEKAMREKLPEQFESSLTPFSSDIETLKVASLRFLQSGKTTLAKRLDEIQQRLAQGAQHVTISQTESGELSVQFTDLSDVPDFIQTKGEIDKMKIALEANENMTLTGPAGSGKTLAVQYLAKITNRPLIEVQGGSGATFERLIGMNTITEQNGASVMSWDDAIVPLAMRTENAILYFDEPNSIPDDVRFYLHPTMDYRRTLTYANGQTLKAKAGFVVIGAMNEGYSGTTVLNPAFRDRSVGIPFDYLPKAKEMRLLKANGADADFARRLVNLAGELRREAKSNRQMRTPISTRSLLQAVNLRKHGATEIVAVEMAILEKIPAQYQVEKKAVSDAITAHFGATVQANSPTDTTENES